MSIKIFLKRIYLSIVILVLLNYNNFFFLRKKCRSDCYFLSLGCFK